MTSRNRFIACAAIVAVLAGCSGSHAVPPVTTAASSSTTPQSTMSTAKFTLTIPSKANTSPAARRMQYVSASTQSGGITVNGGSTVYGFDLTAGGPNCTNVVSGRTCAISVPAPVGNPDTFALTLYDGVLTSGQPTGTALSASVGFTAVVAEGKTNVTTPLVLDGIPASYQLVIAQEPVAYATTGGTSNGTMVLDVYDADANLIVGPGSYTTGNNATTGFTIATASNNYKLSVNGGATAGSIHTSASTDQLTMTQSAAALGAYVSVTPDVAGPNQLAPAFIRPSGFTTNNIEAASFSSGAMGSQLAPFSEQTFGVAGFANYGAIGQFSTDADVGAPTSCGTGFLRNADYAEAQDTGWLASGLTVFTYDLPTCTANPQFPGATDVGAGTGIYSVETPLLNGCQLDYMYPGVEIDPGSGAPPNCSYPHDLLNNQHNYFAVIETNTADTLDHLGVYNGLNFTTDVPITIGGTLISSAARVDDIFIEQLPQAKLWSVSEPGSSPAALRTSIPLPGGYTYVNNTHVLGSIAYSNRTLAIGSDGFAYIAVSSPYDGVLCFDPLSGTVVTQLPNASPESSVAPFNVVSDNRGTIYWSAGAYVMHYPSSVSST